MKRRVVGLGVFVCAVVMAGCTQEFADAMAVALVEGTLQSLPGVEAPGRYEVSLESVKLAKADFASNDDPDGPELFVIVKHRGRTVLSTLAPRQVEMDSYQANLTGASFQCDWQRGDLMAVELWDEDFASHDMLVRWVSTDADAPIFAKRLATQAGTEVVFTRNRIR